MHRNLRAYFYLLIQIAILSPLPLMLTTAPLTSCPWCSPKASPISKRSTSIQKLSKWRLLMFLSKLISHLMTPRKTQIDVKISLEKTWIGTYFFVELTSLRPCCVGPPTWAWCPSWRGCSRIQSGVWRQPRCGCTETRSPQQCRSWSQAFGWPPSSGFCHSCRTTKSKCSGSKKGNKRDPAFLFFIELKAILTQVSSKLKKFRKTQANLTYNRYLFLLCKQNWQFNGKCSELLQKFNYKWTLQNVLLNSRIFSLNSDFFS